MAAVNERDRGIRRLELEIADEVSLSRASDVLHDAFFSRDDLRYDAAAGQLHLILSREMIELASRRRVLPFVFRLVAPRMRCRLVVCSVAAATVEVTDGIGLGQYCLEGLTYDASRHVLRLTVMGPLRVELVVAELRARLHDVGQPTWEGPNIPTLVFSWRP